MRNRILAAITIATIAWLNGHFVGASLRLDMASGIAINPTVVETAWFIPLIPLLISFASFLWLAWDYDRKGFWIALRAFPADILGFVHSPTRALP